MKARVKNFDVEVEPMTKYEYNAQILKGEVQHLTNKKLKDIIVIETVTSFG